jgi:hypothetical protein
MVGSIPTDLFLFHTSSSFRLMLRVYRKFSWRDLRALLFRVRLVNDLSAQGLTVPSDSLLLAAAAPVAESSERSEHGEATVDFKPVMKSTEGGKKGFCARRLRAEESSSAWSWRDGWTLFAFS